jgi:hypothetical protein
LGTVGKHFHFCPPVDGALGATRLTTEGSVFAGALEPIGPGATGSTDD